ncbi:MAG: hypothetical protein AB1442_04805, partial [Nitrospirota bacterium]
TVSPSSAGGIDPFAQTTDGIAETEFEAAEVTVDTIATITASVGGVSDSVDVTIIAPVIPPTPTSVSVAPPTANICENSTDCIPGGTVEPVEVTFTISGGTPPYTVTSDDTAVILNPGTIAASPFEFTVNAINDSIAANTDVTLTVTDSSATPGTDAAVVTVINE